MNLPNFKIGILLLLFFNAISFSQKCSTFSCDSLSVRAILDSNGCGTTSVDKVIDSAAGRIITLNFTNVKRITDEIGNLTALKTLKVAYNLYYISPAITSLDSLKSISLMYTRMCNVPDTIATWVKNRNYSNFVPECSLPVIKLNGKDTIYQIVGTSYRDPGAVASQNTDGDLTERMQVSGTVDTSTIGKYTIYYSVKDNAGNTASISRTVYFIEKDTIPPSIVLSGASNITIYQFRRFVEPGVTAVDLIDGDLSDKIVKTSDIDSSTPGTYHITYQVSDRAGNVSQAIRTVTVLLDNQSPTIKLSGDNPLNWYQGIPYKDPGAEAKDPEDGDLSSKIVIDTSSLDVKTPGTYKINYTVKDLSGNACIVSRTINILRDTVAPEITILGNNPLSWPQGVQYRDPGIRAKDPECGNVAHLVKMMDSVDVNKIGEITVHFRAYDYAGNFTSYTRIVRIIPDTTPPRLELLGDTIIHIALNGSFVEPGYSAFDDKRNINITKLVKVEGTVDSSQVKEFELRYSVTDSSGISTIRRRHIFVDSVPVTGRILFNQLGYMTNAPKIITVDSNASTVFSVYKYPENILVKTGNLLAWKRGYKRADITDITEPGRYQIRVDNIGYSHPITIGNTVYNSLIKALLKAYYFQRASFELKSEFAGVYKRPAGHPDTSLLFYEVAGRSGKYSSPGGWYDAGDYGKYIVNAGITIGTFLNFYELYPDLIKDHTTNIPESNNQVSDLLDEVNYELKWFATMQDTDGGVFFKVGPLKFPDFIMPDKDIAQRYVIGKSTASTLNFAAVMAMASRVWKTIDKSYSDTCLNRAIRAWKWAKDNPSISEPSEKGGTGDYRDSEFEDEFFWAGTELYITTGDISFKQAFDRYEWMTEFGHWQRVYNPGVFSILTHLKNSTQDSALVNAIKLNLIDKSAAVFRDTLDNVFSAPYESDWGSNSDMGNKAIMMIYLYKLTGDKKYLGPVYKTVDYHLGHNQTGYSFVTGFGYRSPQYPHHRVSGSDGIAAPVPGFVVGGPYHNYVDNQDDYKENEVAINWNVPLFFITGFLNAENNIPVIEQTVKNSNIVQKLFKNEGITVTKLKNVLRISFVSNEKTDATISIFDLKGRLAFKPLTVNVSPGASSYNVNIREKNLANGFYIVKVKMNQIRMIRPVMLF